MMDAGSSFFLNPEPICCWPDVIEMLSSASVDVIAQSSDTLLVSDLHIERPSSLSNASLTEVSNLTVKPRVLSSKVCNDQRKKLPRFKFTSGKKEDVLNPPFVRKPLSKHHLKPLLNEHVKPHIYCHTEVLQDDHVKSLLKYQDKKNLPSKVEIAIRNLQNNILSNTVKVIDEKMKVVSNLKHEVIDLISNDDAVMYDSDSTSIDSSDLVNDDDSATSVNDDHLVTSTQKNGNTNRDVNRFRVPPHIVKLLIEQKRVCEERKLLAKKYKNFLNQNVKINGKGSLRSSVKNHNDDMKQVRELKSFCIQKRRQVTPCSVKIKDVLTKSKRKEEFKNQLKNNNRPRHSSVTKNNNRTGHSSVTKNNNRIEYSGTNNLKGIKINKFKTKRQKNVKDNLSKYSSSQRQKTRIKNLSDFLGEDSENITNTGDNIYKATKNKTQVGKISRLKTNVNTNYKLLNYKQTVNNSMKNISRDVQFTLLMNPPPPQKSSVLQNLNFQINCSSTHNSKHVVNKTVLPCQTKKYKLV